MSSSKESNTLTPVLILLSAVVVTAVATFNITKRREEEKQKAQVYRQYQRDKLLKEKTAAARSINFEPPSGTEIDIKIEKVYLWECEDLRKRFKSSMTENVMKCKANPPPVIRSPLLRSPSAVADASVVSNADVHITQYNKLITDHECILADIVRKPNGNQHTVAYMRAGPRRYLHFNPKNVNAAIVTCGGLCPGLNNVIRELVKTLHQIYGIEGFIYGIQGGYRGFYDPTPHLHPLILNPEVVENIHHEGGTVLGSSRGGFDLDEIISFLEKKKISQLYVIGGDGTHRGAFRIHEGCMEKGLNVAVAG